MTHWTEADQAELDVLIWALCDCWHTHRRSCRLDPCPHLIEAIAEVVDWREARMLLTRAEELRAARDEALA
jgi:hypothetical protein